jgi:hypothetical protein
MQSGTTSLSAGSSLAATARRALSVTVSGDQIDDFVVLQVSVSRPALSPPCEETSRFPGNSTRAAQFRSGM